MLLSAAARDSRLSRAQVVEIETAMGKTFDCLFIKTQGDLDKQTSLRSLDSTDFFTKELDEMVLNGKVRFAIHSAKDLPVPLKSGLEIVALTQGIDPRDALVLREGEALKKWALVGTSSMRREEAVKEICPYATFCDIRGTIDERLHLLDTGIVDGVVIAEAALIRLHLQGRNRIYLPGPTAALQGKLAIVAKQDDSEIRDYFQKINAS